MDTEKCSRAQARSALLGYKRQGFRDTDPDDPEQIDAYLELRRTTRRVGPEAFVAYCKKRVKKVSNGEQVSLELWAVPKTNFPKGLPPKIQAAYVAEDSEILDGQTISVDRDKYYLVDKMIDRSQLGKGVWTASSYMGIGSSCAVSGPGTDAAMRALPGPGRPDVVVDADADAGAASSDDDDAPLRPATGGGHGPATSLGLALLGAPAAVENPELKKAKTQLGTLRALRVNITKAADAGVWVHKSNSLNPNSVLFWVEQTLLALQELGQDPQGKMRVEAIAVGFRTFLVNFVYAADCYPEWCNFKGVLPRLESLIQGDELDECKLLENLALTNPDGFEFPKVRKQIKIKQAE